jgi:hypothetical protein
MSYVDTDESGSNISLFFWGFCGGRGEGTFFKPLRAQQEIPRGV